jgi:hypothetical protein
MSTIALTLDAGGAAGAIGDWVVRTSGGVARATSANLATYGSVYGCLVSAGNPGTSVSVCIQGTFPASITGLAASAGKARVNGTTCKAERVTNYAGGDYPIGLIDALGSVAFGNEPRSVGSTTELRSLPSPRQGAVTYVTGSSAEFRFDPTSAATHNGTTVVAPTDGSRGRWLIVEAGGSDDLVPTSVKTADYTAAINDLVQVDPSGGAFNVQLPTAVGQAGKGLAIASVAEDSTPVTVAPFGAETISGRATLIMETPLGTQGLISTGAAWIASPGPAVVPAPDFHELIASPRHAWDAADTTFTGMDLATWPARVGGATLLPVGSGNGYLADDDGYAAATFTGGGRVEGDCQLSSGGTTWGYAFRYRATAIHGLRGCVVGWVTSPTPNAQWVVACVYADDVSFARFGQVATSGGDNSTSGSGSAGTGVGTAYQVGIVERAASTLTVTLAGVAYTCSIPAGTAPLNRINLGYLNYSGASVLYPFSGAISHIVTVDGRGFTGDEKTAMAAWAPPA